MEPRLKIKKDGQGVNFILTWYSPMAIGLAIISAMLFGSFFSFYSFLSGKGMELVLALIPLLFLALGFVTGYVSLCLFLNKTYIHLSEKDLHLHHQPLPWPGNHLQIPRSAIKQLYVKEKIRISKKGGKSYQYYLMAQLKSGTEKKLFTLDTFPSDQLRKLERSLEYYLRIPDQAVNGEFIGNAQSKNGAYLKKRNLYSLAINHPTYRSLFLAEAGEQTLYQDEPIRITKAIQYDWQEGNSDKLLRCISNSGLEQSLYIRQVHKHLEVYRIDNLPEQQSLNTVFRPDRPVQEITWKATTYFLGSSSMGKSFEGNDQDHEFINQWLYLSSDQHRIIRVLEQNGQLGFFQGVLIETHQTP